MGSNIGALIARFPRLGRRGAVAMLFGVAMVPMVIGTVAVIDISRMVAAKSALQRITDNAALTGAAMYKAYTPTDAFRTLAINMATSSFCNSATNLPGGFTLAATTGATACGGSVTNGPVVIGQISGYTPGTRGLYTGTECTKTTTVATAPVKCAFAITVTARADMTSLSAHILGNSDVSVTSTAVNPFIDLGKTLNTKLFAAAANGNSLWVYPVVLDSDGKPDFSTPGALPDRSLCTGAPEEFNCGVYTLLASTHFINAGCLDTSQCTYGDRKVGSYGAVKNPVASQAVITATTPLGFAFSSAASSEQIGRRATPDPTSKDPNVRNPPCGFYGDRIQPPAAKAAGKTHVDVCGTGAIPNVVDPVTGCVYPFQATYGTVTQMYPGSSGSSTLVPWTAPNPVAEAAPPSATHWFYSSFLYHGQSPMQLELNLQARTVSYTVGTATHYFNQQKIAPVEDREAASDRAVEGVTMSNPCPKTVKDSSGSWTYSDDKFIYQPTYYEAARSNCALYITRDAVNGNERPDPAYFSDANSVANKARWYGNFTYNKCFTPGVVVDDLIVNPQYSIIQCGGFQGHKFYYYWNDASGKGDDTDYFNGTGVVDCSAQSQVILID